MIAPSGYTIPEALAQLDALRAEIAELPHGVHVQIDSGHRLYLEGEAAVGHLAGRSFTVGKFVCEFRTPRNVCLVIDREAVAHWIANTK